MTTKYIYHITTTTGHSRESPKSEVMPDTLNILKGWVEKMLNGEQMAITNQRYSCRAEMHDSKFCEFVISRIDEQMHHTDLVRFVVCRHSRKKKEAWGLAGGVGESPNVPFCAVQLGQEFTLQDLEFLPVFADFERCIAWAWIEYQESK